jgi:hypothetical protein
MTLGLLSPMRHILGLSVLAASFPFAVHVAPAQAKVRVVPYAKAGVWHVRAVFSARGPFDHCSANAKYKSGTRVSIIAYKSGNWRLWFAHPSWPDRGLTTFPATLQVDGRTVLTRTGNFKRRNAYIDLGSDINRVKALMRGRQMAVISPSGTSRFSLNGSFRATVTAAKCWKSNYTAPSSGGAFGAANNSGRGAFGGGAFGGTAPRKTPANQLNRANTLELATQYLAKSKQPYAILPANKNTLKHFPVNWKYSRGGIGGMRVFKNTSVSVEKLVSVLLADQAKLCKGRNASQRDGLRTVQGRQMIRAKGVCETSKGAVLDITYKVAELGQRMVMMVMEVNAKRPGGHAGGNSSSGGTGPIRMPGPQEL